MRRIGARRHSRQRRIDVAHQLEFDRMATLLVADSASKHGQALGIVRMSKSEHDDSPPRAPRSIIPSAHRAPPRP